MPPPLQRLAIGSRAALSRSIASARPSVCPVCALSRTRRLPNTSFRLILHPQSQRTQARWQTTLATTPTAESRRNVPSKNPRLELREALNDLNRDAPSHINISRLQLAIRGVNQPAGEETIRIAILGVGDGGASLRKAKELARLLVADPLNEEEEWERILVDSQQGSKPILLKVGGNAAADSIHGSRMVQELYLSSPSLNGHKLEILVLEMDPPRTSSIEQFAESVLVPTMEIPTSSTGRFTFVTTPIHRSLIVADGIMGAATLLNLPSNVDQSIIGTAVDLQLKTADSKSTLPFPMLDIAQGTKALNSIRKNVANALAYEKELSASNVPRILEWVKSGTSPTEAETKQPLRRLIESLLRNASESIEATASRQLGEALSAKVPSSQIAGLQQGLSEWGQEAHTELRDQLDIAFNGQRWRKLGWWKLFWRVDDVSMIASDILARRFLTTAEKDMVFLSGRLYESGILNEVQNVSPENWAYIHVPKTIPPPKLGVAPELQRVRDFVGTPEDNQPEKLSGKHGPVDIPITRTYLVQETVPRLQALAQNLVFQTLGTSSFASLFGGLMYFGSVSTGVYEAGAVVALGIVWSLRRMQTKWETARAYWEGEVREEGRKAVRSVELGVGEILSKSSPSPEEDQDLKVARVAVKRVEEALKACK